MPGTVSGTIGNNAGVLFAYAGNGGASGIHLDIGFQPSWCYFRLATATHTEWQWSPVEAYANIATINGWVAGAGGVGQQIGTVTNVASIQGIQVGTDTTVNGGGVYRGYAWR